MAFLHAELPACLDALGALVPCMHVPATIARPKQDAASHTVRLRNVTRACWTMMLTLLISGCQNRPTEDELTQTLQDRIDTAYSHISEARDQLNRLDSSNWQDAVSEARGSTQAAFVDIQNAQYALKKLKGAQ